MSDTPPPEKPPGVRLAELQAQIDIAAATTDKPGHRSLWIALRELARLLAAVIRRLPPEA